MVYRYPGLCLLAVGGLILAGWGVAWQGCGEVVEYRLEGQFIGPYVDRSTGAAGGVCLWMIGSSGEGKEYLVFRKEGGIRTDLKAGKNIRVRYVRKNGRRIIEGVEVAV